MGAAIGGARPVRDATARLSGGGHEAHMCDLKPGDACEDTTDNVTRLCDMAKPGTYIIQVKRQFSPNAGGGAAISNTISYK